uniref:Aquaporin n=2 Tax=Paramoeba aestuarina TaxID=180227 RepID=A0A7S4PLA7_9EUKA|mmetsp:Transcript_7998/g.12103  ORF Transcript_7998/g.12103 Transcript_7998/m.12103 type:complete len:303 (+) Transcript_7998:440-1348(+)
MPVWFWAFIAELIGSLLLVYFGTGVVASAVLTGSQAGIWQVAVVWGIGVSIAIYGTADVSGAHLNPAVSIAMSVFRSRGFCYRLLPIYLTAQFLGSFLAGFLVYATFYPIIDHYETLNDITRGSCESVQTAQFFGEYFPNPGGAGSWYGTQTLEYAFCTEEVTDGSIISPGHCLWLETLSTAILMFVILTVTDPYNTAIDAKMAPFLIGFTVAANISIFSCIQLGMNPARDFGPRLAALCLGWGSIAIPGPQNGFWVYILGPIFGAFLGALVHDMLLPRAVVEKAKERCQAQTREVELDSLA